MSSAHHSSGTPEGNPTTCPVCNQTFLSPLAHPPHTLKQERVVKRIRELAQRCRIRSEQRKAAKRRYDRTTALGNLVGLIGANRAAREEDGRTPPLPPNYADEGEDLGDGIYEYQIFEGGEEDEASDLYMCSECMIEFESRDDFHWHMEMCHAATSDDDEEDFYTGMEPEREEKIGGPSDRFR